MYKLIFTAMSVFLIAGACLTAQEEMSVKTNPVVVTASRQPSLYSETSRIVHVITLEEIENAPVKNLDELLEYLSGVDIRQRGGPSSQADYSIRGGSFDQTLIMLNGIAFNSPQTGHHNGNLPVSLQDIERIEVLEGSGGRVLGANAFSGGINIITKSSSEERKIRLAASGGEYGYYDMNLSVSAEVLKNLRTNYSISREKNDGYIDNTDTDVLNAFGSNDLTTKFGDFSLQFGANIRNFGANSFYTAAFPNQYEETTAGFASFGFKNNSDKIVFSSKVYLKTHFDKFELFRGTKDWPSWYTGYNYHLTNTTGGDAKVSIPNSLGVSSLGLELRHESILSNVLGKLRKNPVKVNGEKYAYYTHDDYRDNASIFVEHAFEINNFNISLGAMANWNSRFDWDIYGGIDASYKLSGNASIFASLNQSGRLPNFTDLYYEGPTNLGNINLKPEKSLSLEIGTKYIEKAWSVSVSGFYNLGTNLIDWVKQPDSTLWQTMNLTELNTLGFETAFSIYPKSIIGENCIVKFANIGYTFITSEKSSKELESLFALDYLRHKFIFTTGLDFGKGFGLNINMSYQKRDGTYYNYKQDKEMPYNKVFLTGLRLSYKYDFANIYFDASNIFDNKYQDIANLPQPGRWMRAGFSVGW